VARFGDAPATVDRLVDIASNSDGDLFVARADLVSGVADADSERIRAAADVFERGGARVYAAEAAAALAVVLRGAGRSDEAASAAARAEALRHVAGVRLVTPALERSLS
jgi:hypothetical protein